MTWNPRDASAPGSKSQSDGFRLPDRPVPGSGPGSGTETSYLPPATPTMAEAMEWDRAEHGSVAMPPDLEQELVYEGIFPSKLWDRWRTVLLRGHYE